jgi:hypothetical protein
MTAITAHPNAAHPERRPRAVPATCALCGALPASAFGLCRAHLAEAADELARLTPRTADPDDPRPSAVHARDLCGRCGSWKHRRAECPS